MDIGYHFDLTRHILAEKGFSTASIDLALIGNGYNDLLGNLPSLPNWAKLFPKLLPDSVKTINGIIDRTSLLHCDNLFNGKQCINYWKQYLTNLKAVLDAAKAEYTPGATKEVKWNALLRGLYALGITFHVVQDFCSHSTWCETRQVFAATNFATNTASPVPRIQNYQAKSFFKKGGVLAEDTLVTDRFGRYYGGGFFDFLASRWQPNWIDKDDPDVNKAFVHGHDPVALDKNDTQQNLDHQDRRIRKKNDSRETWWDEAYVTGFVSSRHLILQIEAWMGDTSEYWTALRRAEIAPRHDEFIAPIERHTGILEMLFMRTFDGHWKGPGSSEELLFLGQILALKGELIDSLTADDGLLTPFREVIAKDRLVRQLYEKDNMGAGIGDTLIAVDPPATDHRVLTLTVHDLSIEMQPAFEDGGPLIGEIGSPEPYLEVVFIEADAIGPESNVRRYRERNLVETVPFRNRYVLDAAAHHSELWQVMHLFPKAVNTLHCEIRLREDNLWVDRDYRINPSKDGLFHSVNFSINVQTGKLVDNGPVKLFIPGSEELRLMDDNRNLFVRTVRGVRVDNTVEPMTAEFTFTLSLAAVSD